MLHGYWVCPLITIAFTIEMKMRAGYLLIVRISVGRTVDVQSRQNNNYARTRLKCRLRQTYEAPVHIQEELLSLVRGKQFY